MIKVIEVKGFFNAAGHRKDEEVKGVKVKTKGGKSSRGAKKIGTFKKRRNPK